MNNIVEEAMAIMQNASPCDIRVTNAYYIGLFLGIAVGLFVMWIYKQEHP